MIRIKNVSKSFGKQKVLDGISLDVKGGEIFGLLGPSGAGKTTLIKLITGSEKCDTGEIYIANEKVPSFNLLKSIGFMPQNNGLYYEISGKDNLEFFGGLFGMKGNVLKSAVEEKLALVGLTEDAKKLVQNYSGGMKKRLSLAAALLHKPKVLILDEPTVGIDPVLRRRIWEEFAKQRAAGVTIIVTTHVMDEIENCDRAALISNGNILANGMVEELMIMGEGNIENLFFI